VALNPFDTTLGTGPASWYPLTPTLNNAAASAPTADPLAQAQAIGLAPAPGPSAPSTTAPLAPPNPPTPNTIPGLGYLSTLRQLLSGSGAPNYVGQGLGALGGLANLGLGISNNNPVQSVGGGLSATGNIANLAGFPTVGAAAGGLGGLLGIYGGINGLLNGGSPVNSGLQLGTGLAGTYGALSTLFPSVFPSATAALGNLIGAGAGAGAGATGAGAGAGAGAAGAGAAGAGATALVAAPAAAIVLANMISGMLDSQHAAYGAQENFRKLTGDLPQAIQSLRGLPAAFNDLSGGTGADALKSIADTRSIIDPWLNSGLYDFVNSGQTSAGGGWSGQDAHINFPQGPAIAQKYWNPAFNASEQNMVKAYDLLGQKTGQSYSQTPGYDPASISGLNFSPYNLGLQEFGRQAPNFQLVPSPEAVAAAGPAPWQTPPSGFSYYGGRFIPTDVMNDLLSLQNAAPGTLGSSINSLIAKAKSGGYAPLPAPPTAQAAQAAAQYTPAYQDLSGPQA
jgi:hypothetical protein